jgi:hypothetical protein
VLRIAGLAEQNILPAGDFDRRIVQTIGQHLAVIAFRSNEIGRSRKKSTRIADPRNHPTGPHQHHENDDGIATSAGDALKVSGRSQTRWSADFAPSAILEAFNASRRHRIGIARSPVGK